MIINIFSYEEAKKNLEKHKKNWISIRDIGYSNIYKDLDEKAENILELYFDDVTEFNIKHDTLHPFYKRAYMHRGLICFNEEMAKKIIEFSHKIYKKDEELNIHCWAGKSRSQAIGHCLNIYYNCYYENKNIDYIKNIKSSIDNFTGNFDVIRIMTKELYKENF